MTMDMICGYCKEEGNLLCTGCKNVFYCGKEHQRLDWKKGHRSKCKAYEVLQLHIKSASVFSSLKKAHKSEPRYKLTVKQLLPFIHCHR